ncbi:hypothetical protein [Xenorhabdus sp. KJ12.1]|uniref:hypothetical protein n=1 Tax=Xenorhabdus sp. KJ12.1 TaxID=1851571 RepID=UPI000C04801E|nr:hypothetical protein [Xenorhabdus sp. KJ12.1]PHM72343.1 hypothetical protein Xekj_00622 [Xenorhabdus sp. KJ12.1]
MGKFRLWLELLVYRFTVSNKELSMVRNDRKLMGSVRRKFNEIERCMRVYESEGGNCSEVGGSGVSLMFMGFKIYAFRPLDKKNKDKTDHSGGSTVVQFDKYRTK